jgi:hypothetical protein
MYDHEDKAMYSMYNASIVSSNSANDSIVSSNSANDTNTGKNNTLGTQPITLDR